MVNTLFLTKTHAQEISPETRASISDIVISKQNAIEPKEDEDKKKKNTSSAQLNMKVSTLTWLMAYG